jgi:O-antigen ligase
MSYLLPGVAALASLLILPFWSFSFDVIPKVVVILAGSALALLHPRQVPVPRTATFKWFEILVAVQALAILLATLFSKHHVVSLVGSTWRRSGLFAEIAVLILAVTAAQFLATDRGRLRPFLRITVLAAFPVAIYGIVQYFGFDPFMPSSGYHFGEGRFMIVRPPATLGHATYLATYLLYVVFAGAALAQSETRRAWRAWAIATSGLAGFAIVLSGTRAALLGLLAGALFLVVRKQLRWRWAAGALVLLALIAALYVSPGGEKLRARVLWSSEDRLGGARLLLWRDTLRMSAGRWFTGYGPETFTLEFPPHQSLALARAFPEFYHESPHNIFLDALVSQGVLGLLALMALAGLGCVTAHGPVGGAFIAMLVSQQFSAFTLPTQLYFYLCMAILVSDFKTERVETRRWRPFQWVLALPLACAALYLAAGDVLLASARRELDRGDVESAVRSLDRARAWGASADVYFSRRFLAFSQASSDTGTQFRACQYAMDAAARAPNTAEDRQNALLNLAGFYAMQNNATAVERSLREAIAAAPNWFKPHWLLAQVLARDGHPLEAEAEARAAVERDGEKDPEVSRTLEQLRRR